MERIALEQQVAGILVEQLGMLPEDVTLDAKLVDDLGADSLDSIELVLAFEDAFDIEINEAEAEKLVTVGDVVNFLAEKIA
jgi:acyl carrier protein